MKKKIILLSLCLLLLLTACKKKTPAETVLPVFTQDPAVTLLYKTEAPDATGAPASAVIDPDAATPEVVQPNLGEGVDVSYESLHFGDAELDEMLDAYAQEKFQSYIQNASSVAEFGGNATYSVHMTGSFADDKLLSAVFTGSYSVSFDDAPGGEESGDVFYTVNLNRANGKLLTTADIVSDYDALQAAFPEADFSAYRADYGVYPDVYLTADDFHVYVKGDGFGAVGKDYAIPRADAAAFLQEAYR